MYLANTTYRPIKSVTDYKRCHGLMKRTRFASSSLSFPTVIAERNERVLGLLSTRPSKKAVIAGPLVIEPDMPNKAIVAMRLIEAYEEMMRRLGITQFLFAIPEDSPWLDQVSKYAEPYVKVDGNAWFRRNL